MPEPKNQFPDLPETFDLNELKGVFSAEEIAELAAGDDPVVKLDPETPKESDTETLGDQDKAALEAAQLAQQTAQQQQQAADEAKRVAAEAQKAQEPPVEIPDTAEADAVIKAFDAKLDEIQTKYDDGDMTRAEMNAAVKALNDQVSDAKVTISRATEIIQTEQAKANTRWNSALDTFKAAGNEALWSQEHVKGFDASLKAVTGNPENSGLPFDALIKLAARQYQATFEARTGQTLTIGQAPKPADPKPQAQQKQERPDAPQLLGGLNGDGGLSVDDGTFAAIDRTMDSDPLAAEKMLARLPAATREAYLRGA